MAKMLDKTIMDMVVLVICLILRPHEDQIMFHQIIYNGIYTYILAPFGLLISFIVIIMF